MRNGTKGSANSIQSPIGGGDSDNLQPREAGHCKHPPAKDHTPQDRSISDMRQIGYDRRSGCRGYSPCVTSHYYKVGWSDILTAEQSSHFGIIVITDADTNKFSQRPMPHADEPRVRESTCELLLGAGQGLALSGNTRDR